MTTLEKAAQAAWSKKFGTPLTALEGTQWEDIFRDEWVSVVQAAFEAVQPIDPPSAGREEIAAIIHDIVDSDLDGNLVHVGKAADAILAALRPTDTGWRDIATEHMVQRFLRWRLPENFSPDNGISFKPTFNDHMEGGPMQHNPVGTNLFDYEQAKAMVLHMLESLPK
jgi:hypothetical protein